MAKQGYCVWRFLPGSSLVNILSNWWSLMTGITAQNIQRPLFINKSMTTLKVGDKAPAIRSKDQNGEDITLAQFKGKKIVLYFYPKDNTPGCTKEACSFRDEYAK